MNHNTLWGAVTLRASPLIAPLFNLLTANCRTGGFEPSPRPQPAKKNGHPFQGAHFFWMAESEGFEP